MLCEKPPESFFFYHEAELQCFAEDLRILKVASFLFFSCITST